MIIFYGVEIFLMLFFYRRELKDTERKAMVQLEELRSKLISKETELSLLQADINMLAVDRDNKIMEIEGNISR